VASFLPTAAAGLCDLELEGVREAEFGDPVLFGERLLAGLLPPDGVLTPLERAL